MPKLIIDEQEYKVTAGTRLVLAIQAAGIPIGHRCGGFARCTTCRVVFQAGEPDTMTEAEHTRLSADNLLGKARLSCQIVCDHDMNIHPLVIATDRPEWDDDCGPDPIETVTPAAIWYPFSRFNE